MTRGWWQIPWGCSPRCDNKDSSETEIPKGWNMRSARKLIRGVAREESGQDMIEYALVAALVGLSAVACLRALSTQIANAFTGIGTNFTTAV